jgi:ribonuclease HI
MPDKQFTCRDCGARFTVPEAALAKYPGWTPRQCMNCRSGARQLEMQADELLGEPAPAAGTTARPRARTPARANVNAGPQTGIFTDGGSEPNPGPGGWGAVRVADGVVVDERYGFDPQTTNNRMELTALIEAYRMLDGDEAIDIYADSQYVVKTATIWAAQWQANGWRRGKKREPVLNLDLVQELLRLAQAHPRARPQWIRGHAGHTWNEYADALSRAWQDAPATADPS